MEKKFVPSVEQEDLNQPNEYIEIEIDNITDVHTKNGEEKSIYIEVPPLQLPIVCTTRLENMCIMQKYLRRRKPKNVINKIYNESKSAYNHLRLGYNISCTCKKRKHKISLQKLKKRISFLSSKSRFKEKDDDDGRKTERPSVDISSDDEVLASRVKRKKDNKKNKKESDVSILRDVLTKNPEEDNEIVAVVSGVVGQEFTSEVCEDLKTLVQDLSRSMDVKVIDVMGSESNVIIIIKNLYSHTTDIYVTDMNNTIFEFASVPSDDYSIIHKMFHVSNCNEQPSEFFHSKTSYYMIRFTCCCWTKRKKEIKARFSNEFTKFLSIPHACSLKCSCCCNEAKDLNVIKEQELMISKDDINISRTKKLGVLSKNCNNNAIIKAALNFVKPKHTGPNHNLVNKRDQQLSNIVPLHLKYFNSMKKLSKGGFGEHFEFAGVGDKREIVFHGYDKIVDRIDKIVVGFKQTVKSACCNDSLNLVLKEVGSKYVLNPNVLNYIDSIHRSKIFKDRIVKKCTTCKYSSFEPSSKVCFKAVVEPIEHIRKAIVGQAIVPKVHVLEQTKYMEEISKTIQEMMVKLEGKFPNISFFINEGGLPIASLPKPYQCYPIEDLTILTQVLEFAQRKMTGQVPAVIHVPKDDTVTNEVAVSLDSDTVSAQTSTSDTNEGLDMDSTNLESYDICSIMIKCNKLSYIKSFNSFIDSVRNGGQVMPTITNVCSLRDNHEIARQLDESTSKGDNATITIMDDDEIIC